MVTARTAARLSRSLPVVNRSEVKTASGQRPADRPVVCGPQHLLRRPRRPAPAGGTSAGTGRRPRPRTARRSPRATVRAQAADQERGHVQSLPGQQVVPQQDGDLGVEAFHGPIVRGPCPDRSCTILTCRAPQFAAWRPRLPGVVEVLQRPFHRARLPDARARHVDAADRRRRRGPVRPRPARARIVRRGRDAAPAARPAQRLVAATRSASGSSTSSQAQLPPS